MSKQIRYEGELNLNGSVIPCYVLDDGTRIISGGQMQEALKLFPDPTSIKSGSRLARLLNYSALKELITSRFNPGRFEPISCLKGEQKINGYEATVLADICELMLDARKMDLLRTERQHIIAEQCEVLIRGFARVGIIALVDEATGYQEARDKTALRQFLEKFLLEEKGRWVKTFPDEFFESIFKMKGWNWEMATKGQKPGVMGTYINNYVWSRIAPGVLTELKRINSKDERGKRKGKNPQFIDVDFGHPKLKEHLTVLTMFAKASGYNWASWDRMVKRALPKYHSDGSAAQELDFPEN